MSVSFRTLFLILTVIAVGIVCYYHRHLNLLLMTSSFHGVDFHNRTNLRTQVTTTTATQAPLPEQPRTNLYFMKTHKTGSSTLQNILIRYAWNHTLVVGLPKDDILFPSYYQGKKFSAIETQTLPPHTAVNMLVHHMVFDKKEVSSVLPGDTIYVTLLRDPSTLFQSAFHYFRDEVEPFKTASNRGLDGFLSEPSRYFKGSKSGQFWWLAKNGMFFDLGYNNLNETDEYLNASIKSIDETFDLVIISEYFDMGLILLKSLMHWEIKDVAYIVMNARKKKNETVVNSNRTDRIYDWNKADAALYKFFNKTFWNRVKDYGENRMRIELGELDFWKNEYRNACFREKMISNNDVTDHKFKMFNPTGIDMMQYQLRDDKKNNETCIGLILPELQWWKKMRLRQTRPSKIKPPGRSKVLNLYNY